VTRQGEILAVERVLEEQRRMEEEAMERKRKESEEHKRRGKEERLRREAEKKQQQLFEKDKARRKKANDAVVSLFSSSLSLSLSSHSLSLALPRFEARHNKAIEVGLSLALVLSFFLSLSLTFLSHLPSLTHVLPSLPLFISHTHILSL